MAKILVNDTVIGAIGYSGGGSADDLRLTPITLTADYYISPSDGEPVAGQGDAMTDFIEVNPSRYVALADFEKQWAGSNYAAWYDANQDFISALDMSDVILTAPATAKYMRLSHTAYSMNLLKVFIQGEDNNA